MGGGGSGGGFHGRAHPKQLTAEGMDDLPLDATDMANRDAPSPQVRRTWDHHISTENGLVSVVQLAFLS